MDKKHKTENGMATVEIKRKFNALRGDHLWIKFSKAARKDQTYYLASFCIAFDGKIHDSIKETLSLTKKHESACIKLPIQRAGTYSIWFNAHIYKTKNKTDTFKKPIIEHFSIDNIDSRKAAETRMKIVYIPMKAEI